MSYINIAKNHRHLPYLVLAVLEFFLLFLSLYIVKAIQILLNVLPESTLSSDPVVAMIYAAFLSCDSLAMGV